MHAIYFLFNERGFLVLGFVQPPCQTFLLEFCQTFFPEKVHANVSKKCLDKFPEKCHKQVSFTLSNKMFGVNPFDVSSIREGCPALGNTGGVMQWKPPCKNDQVTTIPIDQIKTRFSKAELLFVAHQCIQQQNELGKFFYSATPNPSSRTQCTNEIWNVVEKAKRNFRNQTWTMSNLVLRIPTTTITNQRKCSFFRK